MHSGPPWFATHHIGIHWKVSPESPIQKNQSIVLPLWQDRALKPQLRLQTPPTPAIPHQTSSSLQPTPDNHNAASAPKSTNMSTSIGPAQPEGTTISPSQIYKSYTANTSTNQAHLPLQQSTSSLSPHSTSTDLSLTHAPSEANTNPLDSGYGPWCLYNIQSTGNQGMSYPQRIKTKARLLKTHMTLISENKAKPSKLVNHGTQPLVSSSIPDPFIPTEPTVNPNTKLAIQHKSTPTPNATLNTQTPRNQTSIHHSPTAGQTALDHTPPPSTTAIIIAPMEPEPLSKPKTF